MSDQTTPSDDELARDDTDLCEHGWYRLHPQSCPECEDESSSAKSAAAFVGIEVLKNLYVDGNARSSDALERLFNGPKAETERIAASVGRSAREAVNARR